MFSYFSFLELGCPKAGSQVAFFERPIFHPGIRPAALRLVSEVAAFSRLNSQNELSSGRLSLIQALRRAQSSANAYGQNFPKLDPEIPAVWLDPQLMAIPKSGGSVNPLDFLSSEQSRQLLCTEPLLVPSEGCPPPCHKVRKGDEDAIMDRLLESNLACIVPAEALPVVPFSRRPLLTGTGFGRSSRKVFTNQPLRYRRLVGGLFGIVKSEKKMRVIFDRRPQNACETRKVWIRLPAGAQLAQIILRPENVLRGSGKDLSDFYFHISMPSSAWPRQAFGRPLSKALQHKWLAKRGHLTSLASSGVYFVCLKVAGMGDLNTVDVATAVHHGVLEKAEVLTQSNQLCYGYPLPSTPELVGIYIDDLLVLLQVPRAEAHLPALDTDLTNAAGQAYVDAGLPEASHKAFNQQVKFKAWGAEVDGVVGSVGAPLDFRRELWRLVSITLLLGSAHQKLYQIILGLFAVCFTYCRPMFAIFHHVYVYVDNLGPGWHRIPPFIGEELHSASLLLAISTVNIRAPVSTTLYATDATPLRAGACSTDVDLRIAEAVYRACESRGSRVSLNANCATEVGKLLLPVAQIDALALGLAWKSCGSYYFRFGGHINLQEARAVKHMVRRIAATCKAPLRVVFLCDSQVCVGAFSKGRSSSFKLNGILRSMVGHLVASGLRVSFVWVSTGANPADYPSRGAPIPPPMAPPAWVRDLVPDSLAHRLDGRELFSGSGVLTATFISKGFLMGPPFDVKLSPGDNILLDDVFETLLKWLGSSPVVFLYLSPPCSSFSALQNGHRDGPWRSKLCPWGFGRPEVIEGNEIWSRACKLVTAANGAKVQTILEHPLSAYSWALDSTKALLKIAGMCEHVVDLCMFCDVPGAPRPQKPLRFYSTAPWFSTIVKRCDHCHPHSPHLCSRAAQKSAQYPRHFCAALAMAYAQWREC